MYWSSSVGKGLSGWARPNCGGIENLFQIPQLERRVYFYNIKGLNLGLKAKTTACHRDLILKMGLSLLLPLLVSNLLDLTHFLVLLT